MNGSPHLLIQRAIVAGIASDQAFYLDGSVNGGNSGGPIIDLSDGSVVGIVTQRRFLGGPDLAKLRREAEQIRAHCQGMAGRGSVQIMGIDFGGFSQLIADSMLLMREVLEANANSGIGIGFSIEYVARKCAELGIKRSRQCNRGHTGTGFDSVGLLKPTRRLSPALCSKAVVFALPLAKSPLGLKSID